MGSDTDTSRKTEQQLDDKHVSPHVAELDEVDVAAKLAAAADGSLDSATALRLRLVGSTPVLKGLTHSHRRKIDLHLMPLMCSTYHFPTLRSSSVDQALIYPQFSICG
jgi:hypothetical protein